MWHTALITLHAAGGSLAFAAGYLAIRRPSYLDTYFWSLVACIAFLVAVVAVDWSGLGAGSRALFAALTALGAVMVWRGARARRIATSGRTQWSPRELDHLGFTLVALFDAFVVIGANDLGAPGWLLGVVGVAVAVIGHAWITRLKRRLAPSSRSRIQRCPRRSSRTEAAT
jgi:hypothetical protein